MAASKKVFTNAQSPDEVARVVVRAALAEKPTLRYQTGTSISDLLSEKLSCVTGEAGIALTGARRCQSRADFSRRGWAKAAQIRPLLRLPPLTAPQKPPKSSKSSKSAPERACVDCPSDSRVVC